jgi:hypothetical protein
MNAQEAIIEKIRSQVGGRSISVYFPSDSYDTGDIVFYGGCIYTSLIDNNTTTPSQTSVDWMKVSNIKNDKVFFVNNIIGNDTKAVEDCSNYPFLTMNAAWDHAVSLNPTGYFAIIVAYTGTNYSFSRNISALTGIVIKSLESASLGGINPSIEIPTTINVSDNTIALTFENLSLRAYRTTPTLTPMFSFVGTGYNYFTGCAFYYYVDNVLSDAYTGILMQPSATVRTSSLVVTNCIYAGVKFKFTIADTATEYFTAGELSIIRNQNACTIEDLKINASTTTVNVFIVDSIVYHTLNNFARINAKNSFFFSDLTSSANSPATITMQNCSFQNGATLYNFTKTGTASFFLTDVVRNRANTFAAGGAGSYDQTSGPRYQYFAGNTYNVDDVVIHNGVLYRCRTAGTTAITPSQAASNWTALTGYLLEQKTQNKIIPVSVVGGNDIKGGVTDQPFQSLSAAMTFGGANCTYVLIDKSSTYNLSGVTFPVSSTILGVNKSQYARDGNVLNITASCTLQSGITFKDIVIRSDPTLTGSLFFGSDTRNVYFDNVAFDSQASDSDMEMWINYSATYSTNSNVVFNNCSAFTDSLTQWIQVRISETVGITTPTGVTRVYMNDCKGPWYFYQQVTDVPNQGQYETYISGLDKLSINHVAGLMVIDNCVLNGPAISTATSANAGNKLVIRNTTAYNVPSSSYWSINKTGDCPYIFQDFDYNRDTGVTSLLGTPLNDISAGPATYFNQMTSWGTPGALTALATGLTTTSDRLNIPALVSDPFNIIGTVTGNSFVINYTGVYQIDVNLECQTTATAAQNGIADVFINLTSASDIATALAKNSVHRGLVTNATTYPINNTLVTFYLPWTVLNVNPLSIYARNCSGTVFNMQIVKLNITRLRKV